MTRRWNTNSVAHVSGLYFRVVKGRKSPDDLRLEVRLDGWWRPVDMNLGALLADFFYENEDHLYPPNNGYRGGRKYMTYLRHAAHEGYRAADAVLQKEKRAAR